MCIQFQTHYPCCNYTTIAFSTHCQHTGRDCLAGDPRHCPRVDIGQPRRVGYPCPNHSGLRGPNAAAIARQPGSHMWSHLASSTSSLRDRLQFETRTQTSESRTQQLRRRWATGVVQYEREYPGMDIGRWTNSDWDRYITDCVYSPMRRRTDRGGQRVSRDLGLEYWNDPQPWGATRPGGRLMDRAERVEEAVLERQLGSVIAEMYNPDGTLREEVLGEYLRR
jgi:hypothetical protein